MKKLLLGLTLSTSIFLGSSLGPQNRANAGIILLTGGLTAGIPIVLVAIGPALMGLGLNQHFNLGDAETGAAFFMLDEADQTVKGQILALYPDLYDFLAVELENLIKTKSASVDMQGKKQMEMTLSEAELAPILEILYISGQAELAQKILNDLTQKSI